MAALLKLDGTQIQHRWKERFICHKSLITFAIFKMMVLRDTTRKTGPLTNFGLLLPVVCFSFVFGQTLEELSYTR